MKCKKCESRLALVRVFGFTSNWLEDPYENGKKEDVLKKDGSVSVDPNTDNLWIYINLCPDCGYVEFESLDNE